MKLAAWPSIALFALLAAPAASAIASPGERYAVEIQGRVQPRFELLSPEEGTAEHALFLRRARLTLKGRAHTEALRYKFQADFGKGSVALKDFYVDYRLGALPLHLRAGQFKRPFSRQQLNSSGKLAMVERAITDDVFDTGRDIGVAAHNRFAKSPPFEWAVGVFNGTGDKPSFSGDVTVDPMTGEGEVTGGGFSNVPDRMNPAVVGRVGYNYGGIKGYSEADLEGGPLRFALGASGLSQLDGDDDGQTLLQAELDYAVKLFGFSSTGGVYLSGAAGDEAAPPGTEARGAHVQAGYLVAGAYQPTVRYAYVTVEGAGDRQEVLAGFAAYPFGHDFKWQLDGGALITETMGVSATDLRLRTQLQLQF